MSKTRKHHPVMNIVILFVLTTTLVGFTGPALAAGICGTGTWTPGNLEIHHINIGQGDSTLIVGPTGKSLLFDAGESNWNSSARARIIGPYVQSVLGCTALDYVLVSHFHVDHIGYVGNGGLWHLVETQGFTVGRTLVRDYNTYLGDTSGTLANWKTYLAGSGQAKLHPVTALDGTGQVDLGTGVTVKIVAVDGNGALLAGNFSGDASPPSENDYSVAAVISYGNFDEWIGGDLDGHYEIGGFGYTYHDVELSVAPRSGDVDVYRANHHASSHSSSATFINQLNPEVSIVTVGNGNTYGHPAQAIMDRLLATSTVYMTERGDTDTDIGSAIVAGHIVIRTSNGATYTVNGTPYTSTEPVRTDSDGDGYFLEADPNDHNPGLIPAPNGGCGPIYQTCAVSCQVTAGQVLINEVLPNGSEWVELHNTSSNTINLGYCYVDDIPAGSPAYQIPAGTLIPPHGFWTLDRTTYFNNDGDDVRFLKEDASTLLDAYTFGGTGSNLSWYRLPDGGAWAASPTASTTRGLSNTLAFYPIVLSDARGSVSPTNAASVAFAVTFSKAVTGVDNTDFTLTTTGVTGASIMAVSGSGTSYTITVNTGSGDGTIRLDLVDDDSIKDAANNPLGGVGAGNGNFTSGERFTIIKDVSAISKWTSAFDLSHGWTVSQFVRTVGDVNGDGRDDLVGFGLDGVYVSLSTGSGFPAPTRWTSAFDLSHGWTVSGFVRTVGDVNGDGKADLVGFGLDGVYVALSTGSTFGDIRKWTSAFDLSHGWTVSQFVRTVGDINGDGRADLVGFGLDGVYVSLSTGSSFPAPTKWTSAFDLSHGWTVSQYVRTVGDVNGDGRADLVGFGLDGVYVATSTGSGFNAIGKWTSSFDLSHGWTVNQFVRTVGDVNGDGMADLIGFGLDGVYIALSTGSDFSTVSKLTSAFDLSHGWTVSQFVRTVGDVNGGGKADLVGFGLDGVYIATTK